MCVRLVPRLALFLTPPLVFDPVEVRAQALVDVLRNSFRQAAEQTNLGQGFQALSIFGASPGVSAAAYNVTEGQSRLEIDSYKISPSCTFDPVWGINPYVEGTIAYLDATETVPFTLVPGATTEAVVDIKTYSFLGGVGAEFELGENTVIRPMVLAGYSHVSDEATATGPLAATLLQAGRGIAFDITIDSALFGAAVEVQHTEALANDINFDGTIRYNQIFDTVFSASDPSLEGSGTFGVFTASAEIDGPTSLTFFNRELRWIAFVSSTYLPGDAGDALGFPFFFEAGAGVEIVDRDVVSWLEGVSFRGSAIIGPDVTGWTAGGALEF